MAGASVSSSEWQLPFGFGLAHCVVPCACLPLFLSILLLVLFTFMQLPPPLPQVHSFGRADDSVSSFYVCPRDAQVYLLPFLSQPTGGPILPFASRRYDYTMSVGL